MLSSILEQVGRRRRTESLEREPLEEGIIGIAHYLVQQGKPLHILVRVNERIFGEKRKRELEPVFKRYGEILDNYEFSHGISIMLPDVASVERMVGDYNSGKLENVVGMELSSMDAVLCGMYGITEN